ncbi:MAG: hypothetical protein GC159_04830 [Phycisphaera sp.]|nr:hypothetical protein [Phycisphaera sp.]
MSDQEFEQYIVLLCRALRLSPGQRAAITDELRDHMEQRLAELTERGVDRERAMTIALEEFGDASALAQEFTQINHTVFRRRIMRYTLTTVGAASFMILATLAMLPQRRDLPASMNTASVVAAANDDASKAAADAPSPLHENDPFDERVREKLGQPIDVGFNGERLKDVLDSFRKKAGVNLFVNWHTLEGAEVKPDSPVTIEFKNSPADEVLALILNRVGGDAVPLGYGIEKGVVVISTKEELTKRMVQRVYNIRDLFASDTQTAALLAADVQQLVEPIRKLLETKQPLADGRDMVKLGAMLERLDRRLRAATKAKSDQDELSLQVETLIRDTVDPDNWRQNGGCTSSMTSYHGLLTIMTTRENHQKIADLLQMLHKVDESAPGSIIAWP